MSKLLEIIDKLNPDAKTLAASVALCCPFWVVAMHLFGKPFMASNPLWLVVTFAVCLSLTQHMAMLGCVALTMQRWPNEEYKIAAWSIILLGVVGVFFLGIGISVNYWVGWLWSVSLPLPLLATVVVFLPLIAFLAIRLFFVAKRFLSSGFVSLKRRNTKPILPVAKIQKKAKPRNS